MRSDIGPFTIVPHWLLEAKVSDKAIRLYVVLGRYADNGTGEAEVGRKKLAADVGVSRPVQMKRLDALKAELVAAGALRVEKRRVDGVNLTNRYTLVHANPNLGRDSGDPYQGRKDPLKLEPPPSSTRGGEGERGAERGETDPDALPESVDGRPTTSAERKLAREVLSTFNELAETRFTGQPWLRKIILRCREHPEADVADHERAIRLTLQDPWWKDDPNPAVVYGNETVFENALNRKEKGGGEREAPSPRRRYAKE